MGILMLFLILDWQ